MNVLIFGLGLNQGGVGSAKFFASQGAQLRITDLKPENLLGSSLDQLKNYNIEYILGGHNYEDIDWADLIIKNPAVKPGNPYIEYAREKGKKIEQDMGIFLDYVKPSQIIGVTGTKGKSTTASLIYEILHKSRGSNVFNPRGWIASNPGKIVLAGNIGKSVLDTIAHVKPQTLVILEISSFQLESFDQHRVSPKWAVITNLTPDHLNYYSSMEKYIEAKRIIGKYQTPKDLLFLRKNDPITTKSDFLKGFKGQISYFSRNDLPKKFPSHLMGNHNWENMAAALTVARHFGISDKTALNVLSKFKGIPFRMELIKTKYGIKIINDTTATSPEASIQAIKTFPGCILICGGMNKGMNYKQFVTIVKKCAKNIFFLEGDSTEEIKRLIKNKKIVAGTYDDLRELLTAVKSTVHWGDTILFSPAATSFNLFQNEFDRGRKFNQAVEKIFHD